MAKIVFFLLPVFAFLFAPVQPLETRSSAEIKTDVALRFSKHEGFNRVVLESSNELFIKDASVSSSQNRISVLFPSPFNLQTPKNSGLETSVQEKTLVINVNSPFKIKVLQLSSPPRLSIDIFPPVKEESPKSLVSGGASADVIPGLRMVIDPGHGGYDLGIISGELREKDVTLSIARSMESGLLKKSKAVYLTRRADQYLSITDRALLSNQKSPDIFISIHLSPADNFVIYTSASESTAPDSLNELYGLAYRQRRYAEKSRRLEEGFAKVLKEEFKRDVIFRKMDLPLLVSIGAAAVMIEVPEAVASDQAMRARISDALIKGIAAYANK